MSKDFYKILGVEKNASQDEIKKAFRKIAHEHHPDKKGGDEKKFKEANEAYQTLSDPKKRAQYDQFGSAGPNMGGGGFQGGFGGMNWEDIMRQAGQGGVQFDFGGGDFDMGDIFSAFGFGGGRMRRGRSIEADVTVTFKESIHGVKKNIEIPTYTDGKHTGRRKIDVDIPAGVDSGTRLRFVGEGEQIKDGRPGDLYVNIRVTPHAIFRKEGMHIVMDMNVKLTEAILGAEIKIETLDGTEKIKIPHGMQPGAILRVSGKGVQGGFMQKGDLLIVTHIEIPKHLSKNAKELIEKLKKEDI